MITAFLWLSLWVAFPVAGSETVGAKLSFEGGTGETREIEIWRPGGTRPVLSRRFRGAEVVIPLRPGEYSFRVRSLDSRDVPGEWSDRQTVLVRPKPVEMAVPTTAPEVHIDRRSKTAEHGIRWPRAAGARRYKIRVISEKNPQGVELVAEHPEHVLRLGPGVYTWQVVAVSAGGIESAPSPPQRVVVRGARLDPPAVSEFKRGELKLRIMPEAATIPYSLEYKKFESERWVPAGNHSAKAEESLKLQGLPPGQYRVSLKAQAPQWYDSDVARFEFEVKPAPEDLRDLDYGP